MRPVRPLAKLPPMFHVAMTRAQRAQRERDQQVRQEQAQQRRRARWIEQQGLSPAEAAYIPFNFDPAYPYPREEPT